MSELFLLADVLRVGWAEVFPLDIGDIKQGLLLILHFLSLLDFFDDDYLTSQQLPLPLNQFGPLSLSQMTHILSSFLH